MLNRTLVGFALVALVGCSEPKSSPAAAPSASRQELQSMPAPARPADAADIADADRAFRAWLNQPAPRNPREGRTLAIARAKAMRALLLEDPERALGLALTPAQRAQLPLDLAAHVEQWRDGRGTLLLIGATDDGTGAPPPPTERFVTFESDARVLRAGVFGRREHQLSHEHLRLHGVELQGVIALTQSPLRQLFPGEDTSLAAPPTLCPVSKKLVEEGLVFNDGDTLEGFCSAIHATQTAHALISGEEGSDLDAALAASAWTEGPKTVLFIRVDFPDKIGDPITDAAAAALIVTTNNFYVANSYNKTSITGVVTPTLRMPKNAADYVSANNTFGLQYDARTAAKAAGFDTANYSLDIVGFKPMFSGWSGLGVVGGKGTWINGDFTLRVSGHELGHNFGVNHANFWSAGTSIIGAGTNVEYGNPFDMMGSNGNATTHFNAWFKSLFNWVVPSEIQTVATSGTYRIQALETEITTGLHALKVPRGDGRDYWLEFRPGINNVTQQNGTSVNFGYAYSTGSHLLDMSPDGNTSNSALLIGRTFSDPLAGIYLTPVAKAGTTPEALDIVVNLGAFPGNRPPTVSIAASATTVAANAMVSFTATASDPDGDPLAYAWDFDDATFGPNAAVVSKSLPTSRVYSVRCTVSDMKGHTASASVQVTVGTPTLFTLSGTVTSASLPLGGVRITDGTRSTFSSSDGTYTLTQVPAGSYTLTAIAFDYAFVRSFAAPLTVAASATGLDFSGTPKAGYNVTGKVSSGGTGIAGVVVTDGSRTVTTNAAGDYTLSTVPNGRYTLSAVLAGFQFAPGFTNPVEVYGGNVTANFNATGQFLSGTLPGSVVAPTVTDGLRVATLYLNAGSWNWYLNSVPNGSWNLIATASGVTLTPSTFTNPVVIAGMGRNNLNFQVSATPSFLVSGTVKTGGTPLPNVVISDGTRSATTDSIGRYTLVGVPAGSFTLTPSLSGYSFVPASLAVTVSSANLTGKDFATTVVNLPPTVANPASATPSPVVGTSTALSVLGADDQGEAALTYSWSATGGYPVSFNANGTHGAKNVTATFSGAGTYTLEAVIADAGGLSVRSSVVVIVQQVATSLDVTPPTANVLTGATQVFNGNLKDQFSHYMFLGSVTWVLSGGGTVVSNSTQGTFTAAATPGGPYTLTGTVAGRSGAALINVVAAGAPTLVSAAKATPNPVVGTTTALQVRANDDAGEPGLVYRWTTPLAPAPVTFSVNDTNASKDTVATFTRAGDYQFLVTIVDGAGNQITSLVDVTVNATPTGLSVQPKVVTLQPGQSQQFNATVVDQFGDSLAPQPTVTWSIASGGMVDSSGLFTAGLVPGGPFMLTATAGTVNDTSQVTIAAGPDLVSPMVVLTAPTVGTRLIGASTVSATASDNVGVTRVEFYAEAIKLGESLLAPFTLSFNAAMLTDGTHLLSARAFDAAGNVGVSPSVAVVVGATAPVDLAPPVVAIVSPSSGRVTGLALAVTVVATDDVGVVSLAFELDGAAISTAPAVLGVTPMKVSAGPHTLVAIARDAANNATRSQPVAFTALAPAPGVATDGGPQQQKRDVVGGCGCNSAEGTPFAIGMLLLAVGRFSRRGRKIA